ncbi:MAG: T9SS type A sorting domain-containing protein [Chitinophagales bacterium]|nr:T9SS type A sorting domain-containing protein [Chitinophagales bacterium]
MSYTSVPNYTEDISLISSSHAVQKVCNNASYSAPFSFYFKDINLPSRNVDPLHSKGFLLYALRLPENITPTVVAKNTAYLYFDESEALSTHTTICTLVDEIPTGITAIQDEKTLKVYPNPAQDYLVIEKHSQEQNATFVLYDVLGRQVLSVVSHNQSVVPIEHLPSGVYLYQFINPQNQILTYGKVSVVR